LAWSFWELALVLDVVCWAWPWRLFPASNRGFYSRRMVRMWLMDPRGSPEGERVVVETTFAMMALGEILRKEGNGERIFKYPPLGRVKHVHIKLSHQQELNPSFEGHELASARW
jgi:hypothetical protein